MKSIGSDMRFDGPPFKWDEDDKLHRRARLDALIFHLYGIDEKDSAYVFGTFPIVREQDESVFGHYPTKDLITGYVRTIAVGDLRSRVET